MEQKKTRRADLESKRTTGFLIGLIVSLSLFLAAMQYSTSDNGDYASSQTDDLMRDVDLMPAPDRHDMIAAIEPKAKKASTQKLKVVDKKSKMEKLNDITQMRTVGEGDGTSNAGSGNGGDSKTSDDTTLQPVAVDNDDNPLNFRVVEQLPEFPGGMSAFVKWLTDNLRYPAAARDRNVHGRVVVTFIINRDGSTSDVKVAKSVDPLLDREALRVARMMPRWKPGVANNKPCRTMFAIPIEFAI